LDDLRGVDPGSSTLANVRCMRSPRLQADKAHDGPQSQLVALGCVSKVGVSREMLRAWDEET
jgi:hypothetical protein